MAAEHGLGIVTENGLYLAVAKPELRAAALADEHPAVAATPAGGSPGQPGASPTPTAAEALYDYLQAYHIEVAKDQDGSRYVWTDRALIELADGPPPEPLSGLLASAPWNGGQLAKWVHDNYESQIKSWHAGKINPHPKKQGTDEILSVAGSGHCYINPVYVAYVLSRYPNAGVLIKGPTDPALFTVNGQLRAVVSPWTKLPDGTPLLSHAIGGSPIFPEIIGGGEWRYPNRERPV